MIEHNKTGILFKAGCRDSLAQAVRTLLDERQRWPELKANGRRFVEDVRNWRNSIANNRNPYSRLLMKSV